MNHTEFSAKSNTIASQYQIKYEAFFEQARKQLNCPHCQNVVGFKIHGSYSRHLYINQFIRIVIRVIRIMCTCRRTFVILPPEIIPFKRYVLNCILDIIKQLRTHTAYHIEQQTDITISLINYWHLQYRQWHRTLFETHGLWVQQASTEIAISYNNLRPVRRPMQIISAWTQPFHALFKNHIV